MSQCLCVFGEVLFDHFPDGRRVLGGAPFNVAWHLQAFGENPLFLSRVGLDPEGDEVRAAMQRWGMSLQGMQSDEFLPTGRVVVSFEDGEPGYEIVRPAAWDAILPPAQGADCRLLYHGSLALRSEQSRESWKALRAAGDAMVFVDINLRPPWYERSVLLEALDGARWVKLNGFELDHLAPGKGKMHQRAAAFIEKYGLEGLILTHGAKGASVTMPGGAHFETRPEGDMEIKDTVGAGDALASVMILGLARGWPVQIALDRAQAFASAIVGRRGATVGEPGFYDRFLADWKQRNLDAV